MVQLQNQRKRVIASPSLIGRCVVSCTMVLLTQFALSLVPRFLFASPLLIQLSLSVVLMLVVVGLGRVFKRLLAIGASAPAFVFFNVLFIWCFYVLVIRKGVSLVMDLVFNGEIVLLTTGLCSMLKSDPGLVCVHDEELDVPTSGLCRESTDVHDYVVGRRVRYCKICKAYIKGFDHHCPAFGNCIGQKNYLLFMALLVGFLVTEASFLACSSVYAVKSGISSMLSSKTSLSENLVVSTRLFSILQVIWQVPFFTWHLYCICFNIRTDEWGNWKKYPEFHWTVQSEPGQSSTETRFTNPYDKGILQNVKEFLCH